MLLIKTFLDKSQIQGIGVFSNENVKKGDQVCDYDSKLAKVFEIQFSEKKVLRYPKNIKDFILKYSYEEPLGSDNIFVSLDYDKFVNHSDDPNISFDGVATRGIEKGDELTYDYKNIDTDFKKFK